MRRTLILSAVIFFFSSSLQLFSQVNQEWVNTVSEFGVVGSGVDGSGNLYIGGSNTLNNGQHGLCILKILTTGALAYTISYNYSNTSQDHCTGMYYAKNSNIILTGYYTDINTPFTAIETVVRSTNGSDVWRQFFNPNDSMIYESVGVTLDNGNHVIVAGHDGFYGNMRNALILKYNSTGHLIWNFEYHLGNYTAVKVAVDKSDNIYLTGKLYTTSNENDICTIKCDSSGNLLWEKVYDGPAGKDDRPVSLNADSRGNIIVAGCSDSFDPYGYSSDYLILKYDYAGSLIWERRYDGNYHSNDLLNAMLIDAADNIFVTGSTLESVSHGQDITTVKYDSSGNMVWVNKYNHGLYEGGNTLASDTSGNIYLSGFQDGNQYTSDFITVSLNPIGQQRWAISFDAPFHNNDIGESIAVTDRGYIYVSGSVTEQNSFGSAIIKYSQPIGIHPVSSEVPNRFSLFQNYPNPFNPSTRIKFSLPNPSEGGAMETWLTIYDILGREVTKLFNEQLKPGTYEIDWNASKYPSGVYFYVLRAGDFTQTKKMVLLK